MVLDLDLNEPQSESCLPEGTAATAAVPINEHADLTQSNNGLSGSPIDVETIEDEVQLLSSPADFPQGRNLSRRKRPVTVILDEIEDLELPQSDATKRLPGTILSLSSLNYCEGMSTNTEICNSELHCDLEGDNNAQDKAAVSPPKEPILACPVCMNSLTDPCSTICGHVFCQGCIKASIKKYKKCPICQRKLTKNNFHRVYIPLTQ